MTLRTELDALTEQLEAALAGANSDPYDAIEAAGLAGLRARAGETDHLQSSARQLEVDAVLLAEIAEDAAEALGQVDEDDGEELAWDRLCLMDEVCAAAWWLGKTGVVAPWADLATRNVRGFPEAWAPLAESASRVLADTAPAPGDAALALWRAVEVAIVPVAEGRKVDISEIVQDDILTALGLALRPRFQLAAYAPHELRAAGGLPPSPPWEQLGQGPDWEVVITWSAAGKTVIHVATEGDSSPTVARDGQPVRPLQVFGGWQIAAEPGSWRVRVGEAEVVFRLEE
ncbi:hypothetical protein LBMAG42_56430 [Deltaproteobacteria bacterium]|nr:hypothetical protein LBMAG42_56430 [Deltaproteobacteria bacterium]